MSKKRLLIFGEDHRWGSRSLYLSVDKSQVCYTAGDGTEQELKRLFFCEWDPNAILKSTLLSDFALYTKTSQDNSVLRQFRKDLKETVGVEQPGLDATQQQKEADFQMLHSAFS